MVEKIDYFMAIWLAKLILLNKQNAKVMYMEDPSVVKAILL